MSVFFDIFKSNSVKKFRPTKSNLYNKNKKLNISRYPALKTNYLKTNLLKQIKKYLCIKYTSLFNDYIRLQKYKLIFFLPNIYGKLFKIILSTKRKKYQQSFLRFIMPCRVYNYIIPPMPGAPPIGIAGSFSGLSTMRHSVVRNRPAIDAAFSRATRDTFAGSMTPALRMSS